MDIPLPEAEAKASAEDSTIIDIPVPNEDANRYSPSLPIEDDSPGMKEEMSDTFTSSTLEPTTSLSDQVHVSTKTLLGKTTAKKRLLAFTLNKQALRSIKKLNIEKSREDFFTKNFLKESEHGNPKKKRKKAVLDKARDTISEIEEIKRKENVVRESMQILYPSWANKDGSGPGTGPLALPDIEEDDPYKIENLVEKLLAKKAKKERSDKEKEADKRERRERREREKFVPKSWEQFTKAGFTAYHYRRLKYRREKLPRTSKHRYSRPRSVGAEDEDEIEKKNFNLLETPMILRVPLTVIGLNEEYKEFPSWCIKYTETRPKISYSMNPKRDNSRFMSRKDMLETLNEDIGDIVNNFWEMKPLLRKRITK